MIKMELYEKIHPEGWKNYPDTTTPIEGDNLTHIEEGIYENSVNIYENSVNIYENSVNIYENSVNIKKVNNVTKYITATAGADGDFWIDIENDLVAGMVLYISFPTATNPASNARLSIDGGNTYVDVKLLRGFETIPAKLLSNKKVKLIYNGAKWILESRLIAYFRFNSPALTTGNIPVNINADGGIYDVVVIGAGLTASGNNPGPLKVYYNNNTNDANYMYRRIYAKADDTLTTNGGNGAEGGYVYKLTTFNNIAIVLSGGYPTLNCANTIVGTANVEALNYMQYMKVAQTNITSITFTTQNNMGAGTEVLIYKR
jgi:hypothetical protein